MLEKPLYNEPMPMMESTVPYLLGRALYRAKEFLRHWYVKSARIYSNFVLERFERMDHVLAWKITAKHLFQPLYKDYSVAGYVLGFLFRFVRLLAASAVYAVAFVLAVALYLAWLALPAFIVYRIIFA